MAQIYMQWTRLEGRSGHDLGRALLAQLYETHVGGTLPPIRVEPKGKPYFADSPWHFSISHTKRHVFCVLADRPVGVDAEETDRTVDLKIAPKILSAGELAAYDASEDPRRTLLQFWVLKEAQAKLTGQGIRWHPRHTDFVLPDSRMQEIDGCFVAIVC